MNRSVARSDDGGKTFKWFKGAPGGDDYHFIWINPDDDSHMVLASDQGTTVTVDGGKSWSQLVQPAHGPVLPRDHRQPFPVPHLQRPAGQRHRGDRERAATSARLTFRDWNPWAATSAATWYRTPAIPTSCTSADWAATSPASTSAPVRCRTSPPWPITGYAQRPTTVKYRYNWFYPVVADPHKPRTRCISAPSIVFKTSDGGMHWKIISPDLTGADAKKAQRLRQQRPCSDQARRTAATA